MKNFIKKLREKPEEDKKMILWIIMAVVGLILFSFWIYSITSKLSRLKGEEIIKIEEFKMEEFENTAQGGGKIIEEMKKAAEFLKQEVATQE